MREAVSEEPVCGAAFILAIVMTGTSNLQAGTGGIVKPVISLLFPVFLWHGG